MFDLKQLQLFTAVAEFGSFSRAAVALSVSQPVISRQIKALEEELGVALLYRNGRGIVLTEAGKLLENYASAILEQASRATTELAAMRSNPRGTIVLGMPPSVGIVLTAPLVKHFRAEFPQVTMRVIEGFSGHLLEWLVMGKIDVAVLYNAPRMNNLLAEPILRDELFLLGARDEANPLGPGPVGDLPGHQRSAASHQVAPGLGRPRVLEVEGDVAGLGEPPPALGHRVER